MYKSSRWGRSAFKSWTGAMDEPVFATPELALVQARATIARLERERDEALARVRRLASKLAEAVEPYRAFVRDWLEGDGVGVDQARALLGGTPTKEGE